MKMKIPAIFTVLIALCLQASAGELDHLGTPITAPWATIYTNNATIFSTNTGSPVGVTFTNTFLADKGIYHDFEEVITNLGTNTITSVLSKSIDGTDFVPLVTNTSTITSTPTNFDFTLTGIGIYFQWKITVLATNASVNTYYAGH